MARRSRHFTIIGEQGTCHCGYSDCIDFSHEASTVCYLWTHSLF